MGLSLRWRFKNIEAPIDELASQNLPTNWPIDAGGTLDLSQYIVGGVEPYTITLTGTLPDGWTFDDPIITAASGAAAGITTEQVGFHVADATETTGDLSLSVTAANVSLSGRNIGLTVPAGDFSQDFALVSATGGTDLPFTFGHVFAEQDVPSTSFPAASGTETFQARKLTAWPDGSWKSAVISGTADCSAGVPTVLTLTAGSDTGGSAISLTALRSMNPSASIALSGFGTVTLDVDDTPFLSNISGPVMSEWVYRYPVGSDNHLVVFFRLRYYGGSVLDVLVGVENGYFQVASPTQKDYTATVTINGTQRLSEAIQHKQRTRWAMQFWYGTDPEITPIFDGQYLTDTKLFPNYAYRSPNFANMHPASLTDDLTPFSFNNLLDGGAGGADIAIAVLPLWDALYLTSSDKRAWDSMIANAFGYGCYEVHYRDENTNKPILLNDYPTKGLYTGGGIASAGAAWGGNVAGHDGSPVSPIWATSHHPTPPYVAALLTGEWWFIEEVQFAATTAVFSGSTGSRQDGVGILDTSASGHIRRVAWCMRDLVMAMCCTPDSDTVIHTEFSRIFDNNMVWLKDRHIDGTVEGGLYVNDFGFVRPYGDTSDDFGPEPYYWDNNPWQGAFLAAVVGLSWDMKIDGSADHEAVRDFLYRKQVAMCGPSDGSGFDYRRAGQFKMPIAQTDTMTPPVWFASWADLFDALESANSLTTINGVSDTVLRAHGENSPIGGDAFSSGYWGNFFPALCYSVDHGFLGAADAYERVTQASNYPGGEQLRHDYPNWSMAPR